jgi:hypothetical protein
LTEAVRKLLAEAKKLDWGHEDIDLTLVIRAGRVKSVRHLEITQVDEKDNQKYS